ncbi:hypothetical protein AOLI_G00214030 [Acnodon oligacanthus]
MVIRRRATATDRQNGKGYLSHNNFSLVLGLFLSVDRARRPHLSLSLCLCLSLCVLPRVSLSEPLLGAPLPELSERTLLPEPFAGDRFRSCLSSGEREGTPLLLFLPRSRALDRDRDRVLLLRSFFFEPMSERTYVGVLTAQRRVNRESATSKKTTVSREGARIRNGLAQISIATDLATHYNLRGNTFGGAVSLAFHFTQRNKTEGRGKMADGHDRRLQEFAPQSEDRFHVRGLKWTAGDLEEEKQARPDSKSKVYEIRITSDEPDPTKREQKSAGFLSALQLFKKARKDKMVFVKMESSDDEDGSDIQPMNVPRRKEGQVSHHGFKQLEKSFYKKLTAVEEQVKDLNFYSWVSKRSRSARTLSCPLECDDTAFFSPSDITEDVQESRALILLPGQACDVAEYVPLVSSSSPTKDVQKIHHVHQRTPLTRAMSEILSPKSNTRDQTEESAVRQHIYPF